MPVTQPFTASRTATWAPQLAFTYSGDPLPLDGARVAMQLRLYPGAGGPALLTLNPIAFADADNGDGTRTLTLSPTIAPGNPNGGEVNTFGNLPGLNQPEAGSPQSFAYDIRITYADGIEEILSTGVFTVQPGVTTV